MTHDAKCRMALSRSVYDSSWLSFGNLVHYDVYYSGRAVMMFICAVQLCALPEESECYTPDILEKAFAAAVLAMPTFLNDVAERSKLCCIRKCAL